MKTRRMLAILGAMVLVLAACGPAATPTPTQAPTPTRVVAPATPTPRPTPAPTATPAGPKYGGILKTAIPKDLAGPDPFAVTTTNVHQPLSLVHTRLFLFNQGKDQCEMLPRDPELAERWEWINDRTLDVYLRQGVKYPDIAPMNGREFVASDVVYSATVQWPKMGWLKPALDLIDHVEAVEDHLVRFHLKEPFAPFIEKLLGEQLANIMGPEPFGPDNELEKPEENVGLGPFTFGEWVRGVKITFKKNPNYWRQGLPYLDGVEQRIMPDLFAQMAAMRAGELDHIYLQSPALIQQLDGTNPQLKVAECPYTTPAVLYMHTEKPPFNDIRVRRAISMAIDIDALNKTAFLGKGTRLYTQVMPMFGDYQLKLKDYPPEEQKILGYYPNEARKLIAEAGHPDGFEATLYTTTRFPIQKDIAEALVAMLGNIGIKANLKLLEYGEFSKQIYGNRWEDGMAVAYGAGAVDLDTVVWDLFHSGKRSRNRSRVDDPEMDRLLEAQRTATDAQKRKDILHQIQIYQVNTSYVIFFPLEPVGAYAQPYVKNLYYRPSFKAWADYLYRIWLDK